MRILVVDDDAASRKLLTTAFEVEGFEVLAMAEGLDALGALASQKWKPDVMVLDYMMPDFTGGDVLDAMDAFPGLRQVPVIIASAADQLPKKVLTRANLVMKKPVNIRELVEAVRKLAPDAA
jgi:CheY-like chemotaxis protein